MSILTIDTGLDVRAALKKVKELGRPLTEDESAIFERRSEE